MAEIITHFDDDGRASYDLLMESGLASVVMEKQADEIIPRLFVKKLSNPASYLEERQKQIEELYGKAIDWLAESEEIPNGLRKWAVEVRDTASVMIAKLEEQFQTNEDTFSYSFEMETAIGPVEFTAYTVQELDRAPESIKDIDGYTTDNDAIESGGYNIYSYAAGVVNAKELEIGLKQSKIDLQGFFETYILPFRKIAPEERTKQQQDDFSTYSDWHKSLYHHRPSSEDLDECLQHYLHKEAAREAAMQKDLIPLVIAIEEPEIMETGDERANFSHRVNFNIPMYDEGFEVILDRTALFDQTPYFDTMEDIIDSDSYLNVYLDAYKHGRVEMIVTLADGSPDAIVPLTDDESKRLMELADKALQREGGVKKFIEDNLDETEVYTSEKVEGLEVAMYDDGSGYASLHGKPFASVDLQTNEIELNGKWDKYELGSGIREGVQKFMEYAEDYAVRSLDAKQLKAPQKDTVDR